MLLWETVSVCCVNVLKNSRYTVWTRFGIS
jgi:hypothetical protein